jgi:hypothetical protein
MFRSLQGALLHVELVPVAALIRPAVPALRTARLLRRVVIRSQPWTVRHRLTHRGQPTKQKPASIMLRESG